MQVGKEELLSVHMRCGEHIMRPGIAASYSAIRGSLPRYQAWEGNALRHDTPPLLGLRKW